MTLVAGHTDRRATIQRWHILSLLFLSYVICFIDRVLVSVAGAPIKHDLGLSDSQFGLLHGMAFVVLYCLCGIPLGWLADRTNRRAMIAMGLLFWSVMTAICGLAGSFAMFFIARIGVGLGEACLLPAGISLLASVTPKEKMAKAVAIFLMGAATGNAIALLAGGYLLEQLSHSGPISLPGIGGIAPWQALFLLASMPGVVIAGLVMTIREPARNASAAAPWRAIKETVGHLQTHQRAYVLLTAATACTIILAQVQTAWMPLYYVRHFGLSPGHSAMTIGVMFLMSAPTGQWAGGVLIDYLQARGVAAPPNVVQALCSALCIPAAVVLCTAKHIEASAAGYLLFNFLVHAATPAGLTGWQLLTPEKYRGVVTALLVSIVTLIGVGVGPVVVGVLSDHWFHDEQALGASMLVVILLAAVFGCGLALAGRWPFVKSVALVPSEALAE